MIKAISKWLEAKQNEVKTQQYDEGFGYGATEILKYHCEPYDPFFDRTIFDRTIFEVGARDAAFAISDLQDKAKKLERCEAENADLRETVRKMQTELRQLLDQIPMRAISVALEEPKRPFRIEDLPDWTQWLAQDANGSWFAYEDKPLERISSFAASAGGWDFIFSGKPNENWRSTLQRVREEEKPPEVELPFDVDALPEWANWVAQDGAGRWFAYEKKPWVGDYEWIEDSKDGNVDDVFQGEPNPNWKETLQRLTR